MNIGMRIKSCLVPAAFPLLLPTKEKSISIREEPPFSLSKIPAPHLTITDKSFALPKAATTISPCHSASTVPPSSAAAPSAPNGPPVATSWATCLPGLHGSYLDRGTCRKSSRGCPSLLHQVSLSPDGVVDGLKLRAHSMPLSSWWF